jgi:TonB family protein
MQNYRLGAKTLAVLQGCLGRRKLASRAKLNACLVTLATIVSGVIAGGAVEDSTQPTQKQSQFEWAIRLQSSSPGFIMLTVVDDRTKHATTGCTIAPSLLGAIMREHNLSGDAAIRIALSNYDHVYHFSTQAALDNILPLSDVACDAIKAGRTARMSDMTGRVRVGPFTEGPGVNLGSCQEPDYPKELVDDDKLKPVQVSFFVKPDGQADQIKLVESSGSPVIDQLVLANFATCSFSPRTIDGQPDPAGATTVIWHPWKPYRPR